MATRIPLPGLGGEALQRGVEAGTGMFNQLIGQGVNLGKMHQQGQQFEKDLAQRWRQHLEEMEIKRAYQAHLADQEKRLWAAHNLAAQFQPYQIENLEQQAAHHRAQAQGLEFDQNLINELMSGNAGNFANNMTELPTYSTMPDINLGGVIPPIPGYTFENPPVQTQTSNPKFNKEAMLRGALKKRLGIDPFEETQDQKDAREMDKFKEKERYKAEQKKIGELEEITPAVRSKLQEEIHYIQNVLPLLDELIEMEPQTITWLGTTNDEAYNALTFNIAESLVKAKGQPNTNESIKKMQKSLQIGGSEKAANYKKRMEREKESLVKREQDTLSLLGHKKVSSSEKSKDIIGITKNGKKVIVLPKDKEAFLKISGNRIEK